MKKKPASKIILWVLLLDLVLIALIGVFLSNQQREKAIDQLNDGNDKFIEGKSLHKFILAEIDHKELDFGNLDTMKDQTPVIRDFEIMPSGKLILLQYSQVFHEYTFEGNLVQSYNFNHQGKLDSPFLKITSDNAGNFYILLGSGQIMKTDGKEVLHFSFLGANSLISDPATITTFDAIDENLISITAINHENKTCFYLVDVSKEDAFSIVEPRLGHRLMTNSVYNVSLVYDSIGKITKEVTLSFNSSNSEAPIITTYQTNHPNSLGIYGMKLIGLKDGHYLALIYEWHQTNSDTRATSVISLLELGPDGEILSMGYLSQDYSQAIATKSYENTTYCLLKTDAKIEVLPLFDMCKDWTNQHWFTIK